MNVEHRPASDNNPGLLRGHILEMEEGEHPELKDCPYYGWEESNKLFTAVC